MATATPSQLNKGQQSSKKTFASVWVFPNEGRRQACQLVSRPQDKPKRQPLAKASQNDSRQKAGKTAAAWKAKKRKSEAHKKRLIKKSAPVYYSTL